jgi:hypothetical protein
MTVFNLSEVGCTIYQMIVNSFKVILILILYIKIQNSPALGHFFIEVIWWADIEITGELKIQSEDSLKNTLLQYLI